MWEWLISLYEVMQLSLGKYPINLHVTLIFSLLIVSEKIQENWRLSRVFIYQWIMHTNGRLALYLVACWSVISFLCISSQLLLDIMEIGVLPLITVKSVMDDLIVPWPLKFFIFPETRMLQEDLQITMGNMEVNMDCWVSQNSFLCFEICSRYCFCPTGLFHVFILTGC